MVPLRKSGLENYVTIIDIPPNTLRRQLVRNRLYDRLCSSENCMICPNGRDGDCMSLGTHRAQKHNGDDFEVNVRILVQKILDFYRDVVVEDSFDLGLVSEAVFVQKAIEMLEEEAAMNQTSCRPPHGRCDLLVVPFSFLEMKSNSITIQLLTRLSPDILEDPSLVIHHSTAERWFVTLPQKKGSRHLKTAVSL
ncbi:unnamed protein product [Angiostrongylus costaricensis]|uniref:tRNA-uridine aminocarboxypropyltransferase n=1 Tax=Angiostrongylus costaricensis TaxID=334426 RepID=A0A0R3PXJ8_ANGCS|nr:unnamed protein product [Angiostrongylus costaricensis]